MSDIYDMLVGAPPSTEEQLRATADQLRRRKLVGQLGVLTGDPMMGKVGAGVSEDVGSQVQQLQQARQKDAQRGMMQNYYDAQQENWQAQLAQSQQHHQDKLGLDRYRAETDRLKAQNAGSGARLRSSDITALRESAGALGTIQSMWSYLNDPEKESPGQMEVMGIPIPGGRSTANWAASKGLGTEESKEAAMFWQNFRRYYELAQRNALFGATLTPNEMQAWMMANPNQEQTKEQLLAGIEVMMKVYDQGLGSFKEGLITEGYSPDAIQAYSRPNMFSATGGEIDRSGQGAPSGGLPKATGKEPTQKSGNRMYIQDQGWVEQ